MSYTAITLTASGGTFNNYVGYNTYANILALTGSPVTLTANVVINPSVSIGGASFKVRWNADVTLDTFSTSICGVIINQDQVNQSGTFDCYYDGSAWSVQYFADGTDQPQEAQGVNAVAVPVGGTLTLVAGVDKRYQRLVGSPTTLSSNYTVTAATLGVKEGTQFEIEVGGSVTIGANSFTVFGVNVNAAQALSGGVLITATYDGSVWRGVATSKPITGADLSPQAALSVLVNATNASASPTAFPFGVDGGVLQRSGSGLVTSLLSSLNFDSSLRSLKYVAVPVSSAEILAGFTTPIALLPASVGVTNVPLFAVFECIYGSATYAGNLDVVISSAGAAQNAMQQSGLLGFTSSGFTYCTKLVVGSFAEQLVKGAATNMSVLTGNPTTGDSTMIVHLIYVSI